MIYEVIDHRYDFDLNTGIWGDFSIKLATHKSKKLYAEPIRMVTYHDSKKQAMTWSLSPTTLWSALLRLQTYTARWDIEVFFKWINQNIVLKTLWGYSENAARTHLWVAIIAYLIIAKIKADYKSPYSITEVATLIRTSALKRVDLRDLITKAKDSIIQNKNVNGITLFDDF